MDRRRAEADEIPDRRTGREHERDHDSGDAHRRAGTAAAWRRGGNFCGHGNHRDRRGRRCLDRRNRPDRAHPRGARFDTFAGRGGKKPDELRSGSERLRREDRAPQDVIGRLAERGERRAVPRTGPSRHAAEQFVNDGAERLDRARASAGSAGPVQPADHGLATRSGLRDEAAPGRDRVDFDDMVRPQTDRLVQQRIAAAFLAGKVDEQMMQREVEPLDAGRERVIQPRRRRGEQVDDFVGGEFAPGAQEFEQRKALGPFEREKGRAPARFEAEDFQHVGMVQRRQLARVAFDLRRRAAVVQQLRVEHEQPHLAVVRQVAGVEIGPGFAVADLLRELIAPGDGRAGLEARVVGRGRRLAGRGQPARPRGRGTRGLAEALEAVLDFLAQGRWLLRPVRRILREHLPQKLRDRLGDAGEFLEGRLFGKMLADDARDRAAERRPPGEQVPERDAERVDVGAHVDLALLDLLRAGEVRRAEETAHGQRRAGGAGLARERNFREAEINHLHHQILVLMHDHQVRGLDVAVDEVVGLRGIERAGDLRGDFQRERRGQRTLPFDERLGGFAVDEFHRVEKVPAFLAEMEDRRDVAVPQPRRRAGLAHEALAGGVAVQVGGVDDLERHGHAQPGVEALVGDAHRAAPEFVE